jgi:hypothetical protein
MLATRVGPNTYLVQRDRLIVLCREIIEVSCPICNTQQTVAPSAEVFARIVADNPTFSGAFA